ncbi:MAG TPA: phosphotransferase [Acidimicrobiales bacterium]|nr:phosphotransferase [Acidimicrobiales bacterium]
MAVELEELTEVVERVNGSTKPGPWRSKKLYDPVASATAGIWRVSGDGWSVVLKLVHHSRDGHPNWLSSADPDDWLYWKREVLAYRSGLPDSFMGGLRGPRCLGIFERADGDVALWLEDAGDGSPGTSWNVEPYGLAARHLGHAQGAVAHEQPPAAEPWFARDWLRSYLSQRDRDMELLSGDGAWSWPLVRNNLGRDTIGPLRRMRDDQDLFLGALDDLPLTICHYDLHPANLFTVGDATVLIDWAFVGLGVLGGDAGVLVADSVLDFHVGPELFDDLFACVRNGYLDGLRQAGWTGVEDLVDLGMNATLGARYAWIGPALLRSVVQERSVMNRRPIEEAVSCWARTIPFLLDHAERARRML